jgi:phospholipid-binding lipoprotein MlaA
VQIGRRVKRMEVWNVGSEKAMMTRAIGSLGRSWLAALAALLMVSACALPPEGDPEALAQYEEENDPLEPLNRYLFEVNDALDKLLIRPVAEIYRGTMPEFVRDGIRNFLRNANTPIVLVNDLFQGEFERAGVTLARFMINTIVGFAGFFDVASDMGLEYHDEDFGQTLGSHGVGDGPYLVIPVLGPSNARDASGDVVDFFLNPFYYVAAAHGAEVAVTAGAAMEGIDIRSRNIETLEDLERDSVDFYTRVRSLYRQRRWNDIRNGEEDPMLVTPGITETPIYLEDDDNQLSQVR